MAKDWIIYKKKRTPRPSEVVVDYLESLMEEDKEYTFEWMHTQLLRWRECPMVVSLDFPGTVKSMMSNDSRFRYYKDGNTKYFSINVFSGEKTASNIAENRENGKQLLTQDK